MRVRKVLRTVAAVGALWAVAGAVGHRLAQRGDLGTESSPELRRGMVAGGLELGSLTSAVRRLRLDLGWAGADVAWVEPEPPPGGVDVEVRAVMAGTQLTVPRGWSVWWTRRGPGGVDVAPGSGLHQADSPDEADLRLDATLAFAGVSVRGSDLARAGATAG